MITRDQVAALTGDAERWYIPLRDAMALNAIDETPSRTASFLAQVSHESQRFTRLEENLHYSAARLLEVFRGHFTSAEAIAFAYDPERIANRVYGNRHGNGSEASGDGFRYRGRGPIGLTFKDNYRAASPAVGVDLVSLPDRVKEPAIGALVAGWFWDIHHCNALADQGDFEEITRRINGGMNGINERLAELERVERVLVA